MKAAEDMASRQPSDGGDDLLDRLKRRRDELAEQGVPLGVIVDHLAAQFPHSRPLTRWRVTLNLSQEGLADQTLQMDQAVSLRTVQRVETGENCTLRTLQALNAAIQAKARQAGVPAGVVARRLGDWQVGDERHRDAAGLGDDGGVVPDTSGLLVVAGQPQAPRLGLAAARG